MARAIKFQLPFESLNGTKYIINIYEDGYKGSVITLRGTATPFSTTEDDDDDFFKAVRTQSGYIRIVYSDYEDKKQFDWEDLMPSTNKSHYVELVADDGTVKWCGYMKSEQYDHAIYSGVDEYEFPVFCPFSVLEGYTDIVSKSANIDTMLKFETVHEFLYELLSHADITFNNLYFQGDAEKLPQLFTVVNKSNWMECNDDYNYRKTMDDANNYLYKGKENALEILEDVCTLFGWSLHINGKDLYFMSPDTQEIEDQTFYQIAWTNLQNLTTSNITKVTDWRTYLTFDDVEYASDDHNQTYIKGARSINISGDVNTIDKVLELPFDDYKLEKGDYCSCEYYTAKPSSIPDQMYNVHYLAERYYDTQRGKRDRQEVDLQFKKGLWNNLMKKKSTVVMCDDLALLAAYSVDEFGKGDKFTDGGGEGNVMKAPEFSNVLFLKTTEDTSAAVNYSGSTITWQSNEEFCFNGGYLCIAGSMTSEPVTIGDESAFGADVDGINLPLKLKVGDKWLNKDGTWQGSECTCYVRVRYNNVVRNYLFEQQLATCPSLENGWWFKIPTDNTAQHGKVMLKIETPLEDLSSLYKMLKVTSLNVLFGIMEDNGQTYQGHEPWRCARSKEEKSKVGYYQFITSNSDNDVSVKLKLHTFNDNMFGRSYLLGSDYKTFETLTYEDKTERPEERLLRRMVAQLSSTTSKRQIEVKDNSELNHYPLFEDEYYINAITAVEHDWVNDNVKITMQNVKSMN